MMRIMFFLILLVFTTLPESVLAQVVSTVSAEESFFVTKKTSKAALTVLKELKDIIDKKGLKVFAEYAHHEEALRIGDQLAYTHVIIFGNPRVGTKLMQCDQRIGYELPLRILITVSQGETLIFFRDPKKYNSEYDVGECRDILEKMSDLLHELADQVM